MIIWGSQKLQKLFDTKQDGRNTVNIENSQFPRLVHLLISSLDIHKKLLGNVIHQDMLSVGLCFKNEV